MAGLTSTLPDPFQSIFQDDKQSQHFSMAFSVQQRIHGLQPIMGCFSCNVGLLQRVNGEGPIPDGVGYFSVFSKGYDLAFSTIDVEASNKDPKKKVSSSYCAQWRFGGNSAKSHPIMLTISRPLPGLASASPSSLLGHSERLSMSLSIGRPSSLWQQVKGFDAASTSNHSGAATIGLFDVNLTRSLSDYSAFLMGVSYSYGGMLSWIFQWTQGGMTFRVPVALTKVISSDDTPTIPVLLKAWYICLLNAVCYAFVSDFVTLLQEKRENLVGKDNEERTHPELSSKVSSKARDDALQQQLLMRKAAMSNRRQEEEKENGGLVIEEAWYGVFTDNRMKNDDEEEKEERVNTLEDLPESVLDVAIPMQFWVSDSCLTLPSGSKKCLLGFCEMSSKTGSSGNGDTSQAHNSRGQRDVNTLWHSVIQVASRIKGRQNVGSDKQYGAGSSPDQERLCDGRNTNLKVRLFVRYKIGGILHHFVINDLEALEIPTNFGQI
jgi:hypothetical protein